MYKIILNEYDFSTYDVILKSGDNIITKDEATNFTEAESCILSLYYRYDLPKGTELINPVYINGELKNTYKITLWELL